MTAFVAYWDGGPLTHFEHLCLRSFVDRGHRVELASYGEPQGVPEGVKPIDARDFLPVDPTVAALLDAKAYSKVSDILRYRLLADGTWTWIDVDVMLLAEDVPATSPLFGFEDDHHVNTAILRLERSSRLVERLLEETDGLVAAETIRAERSAWGPLLLTRLVDELGLRDHAQAVEVLYPVRSRDLWRLFDPREREWCDRTLQGASTLHLWNEFLRRAALKERRPARGSWLDGAMRAHDVVPRGPTIATRWVRTDWRQHLPEPPPIVPRPTVRTVLRGIVRSLRRLLER